MEISLSLSLSEGAKMSKCTVVIIASMVALLALVSCKSAMEREVTTYKGDGKISYKPAPVLGIEGVKIEMGEIDLSRKSDYDYNLTGIPAHKKGLYGYMVYLIFKDKSCLNRLPRKGTVAISLYKNNILVKNVSASVDKMTETRQESSPALYYMNLSDLEDSFFIDIPRSNIEDTVRLNIKINMPGLAERCPAEIYLERGGSR